MHPRNEYLGCSCHFSGVICTLHPPLINSPVFHSYFHYTLLIFHVLFRPSINIPKILNRILIFIFTFHFHFSFFIFILLFRVSCSIFHFHFQMVCKTFNSSYHPYGGCKIHRVSGEGGAYPGGIRG